MRKYLLAAAAGGLLLLGAAPAHADEAPAAPGLLSGLLDPAGGISPANGLHVDKPLGDTPLVDVDPGDNTPSVVPTLPAEGTTPAARTGLGNAEPDDRSARAAADGTNSPTPATDDAPLDAAPVADRLGGGLPLLDGLLPDGRATDLPATDREAGLLGGGLPLLGGLLPEGPARTLPADAGDEPDVTGMPAGGAAVPASAPAAGEDSGRTFSDGRPVAGPDPDYQ
jgi:hypothetical protein